MSSGKTHGRVTILLTPLVGLTSYQFTGNIEQTCLSVAGCLLGLLIEPDLDIDHKTASERRIGKIPIIGQLWFIIWLPYAKALPHRSFISHIPIFSTFIRYAYLLVFVLIIPGIFIGLTFNDVNLVFSFIRQNQESFLWLFYGTVISDYGHFMMDLKWIKTSKGRKFL